MTLPPLYLCRHGQTDWNAEGRLQGQKDIPLNELGRRQAARNGRVLGEQLRDRLADFAFVASPMDRTRETMRIVRRALALDPDAFETDDRLVELNFGDWEGSTLPEIEARDPASILDREAGKWSYCPPGAAAESYQMLARRLAPVFTALARPTVMVAHGGTMRSFLQIYGGVEPNEAAHVLIPQDRFIEAVDGRIAWV